MTRQKTGHPHQQTNRNLANQKTATTEIKSDDKEFDFKRFGSFLISVTGAPLVAGIAAGSVRGVMSLFWLILSCSTHLIKEKSIKDYLKAFFDKISDKPFDPVCKLFNNVAVFLPIPEKYKDEIIKNIEHFQKKDTDIFSTSLAGLGFTARSVVEVMKNPTFLKNKPTSTETKKPEPKKDSDQKAKGAENLAAIPATQEKDAAAKKPSGSTKKRNSYSDGSVQEDAHGPISGSSLSAQINDPNEEKGWTENQR